MENIESVKSLVVCVEFDDFLAITLPRNRRHFVRTLVVTSLADVATQQIARENGCECLATDCLYDDGAQLNKGLAVEKGLDVLGRDGWICVWDADVVMPKSIVFDARTDCLYSPYRRTLVDPSLFSDELDWETVGPPSPLPHEFAGYFHLFHSRAAGRAPWYSIGWKHAGGCDSDFQDKFPNLRLKRPPFEVLHLGPTVDDDIDDLPARVGPNWCGRVSSRIDGQSESVSVEERRRNQTNIIASRREGGFSREQIPVKLATEIPRRMSFFWTGRLSWLRWLTLHSFVLWNPGWEVRLYISETPARRKHWKMDTDDDHEYQGRDYRSEIPASIDVYRHEPPGEMAAAQACDYLQWNLLATDGGFFADMDILWLKPLDGVWTTVRTADAVFCLERGGVMAVGFAASRPGCRLFRNMAVSMVPTDNNDYQYYGMNAVYRFAGVRDPHPKNCPGEEALRRLRHCFTDLSILDVPDYTVYPYDWSQVDRIFEASESVYEKATGLHWFGGNRLSRKWNNTLDETTWQSYDNTLTNYLQKVLP